MTSVVAQKQIIYVICKMVTRKVNLSIKAHNTSGESSLKDKFAHTSRETIITIFLKHTTFSTEN